jgi:hypothetical protein
MKVHSQVQNWQQSAHLYDFYTGKNPKLAPAFKGAAEINDIYRFLTGEPDTVPEFQFNWTSGP